MTYGVVVDVAAPVQAYDAMHAELLKQVGPVEGFLLHVGRATPGGFQIIEVWESKELYDRFNEDVLVPLMARLAGADAPHPSVQEFEPRGLVIPRGDVMV